MTQVQERWFEKLHDWHEALTAYQTKLQTEPDNFELALGQMRCLEALGDWEELYNAACERWGNKDTLHEDCCRRMSKVCFLVFFTKKLYLYLIISFFMQHSLLSKKVKLSPNI